MERIIDGAEARDFKDLTVQELARGYASRNGGQLHTCIFCGEAFEEGVIYTSRGRLVTAEKAAEEHIKDVHGGAFQALIELDKQISGLSDVQKSMLSCLFERRETADIAQELGISAATVRSHRFNLQKAKREARIFLALMEQVEGEEYAPGASAEPEEEPEQDEPLPFNSLHPFFTRFQYK